MVETQIEGLKTQIEGLKTQIEGLKCSVVSPTNTLLQLKSRKETTLVSALSMHTKKCDVSKAHFVASPAPSKVVHGIKRCLESDLERVSAT